MKSEICAGAEALGISLSDRQIDQLAQFTQLLLAWNQKVNLISRTTEGEIVSRHIVDSLAPWAYVRSTGAEHQPWRVADLGSGGGLPGIPLKIVASHWEMTLIEPTLKKGAFLREAINRLGLDGIHVAAEHISRRPHPRLARHFDLVVSRATLPAPRLIPVAATLLGLGGRLIAMVSRRQAELEPSLESWSYELPDGRRWSLLVSRKIDPSGP